MRRQITVLSVVVGVLCFGSAGFAGPQVLEVSPAFLGFSASAGGANPASQVLSIWNSGHAPMGWTVTEGCNWLTVDPNAGSSSGEADDVNVIVDISGLTRGTYNCQLTVDAGTAANSPQIVDVQLDIYEPNLVSWWKFDEGSGSTAYDSAGSNDGTIYGAQWTTGQINGALDFDGLDDYVDVGDPPDSSLDFGTSTDFSISLWFNISMSTGGFFVCKRAKGEFPGYGFYIERDGKIFARIADGSSVPSTSTTEGFNDGLWHHAAAVYDRDDVIKIYLDGVSKATSGSIAGMGNIDNSQPFTVGDRNDPGWHSYFDGSVDDVRIYDRALSAEEIQQLYGEGFGGRAFNPNPADGATGVEPDVILSWSSGVYAASHDVYFGTDLADVNDATTGSAEYMGQQDVNSWDSNNYDPSGLEYATTYYWRIDEVNDFDANSPWKGNTWSFETDGPVIELSAAAFEFTAFEGGANPADQILSISNGGIETVNWEITEDCEWLTAEPNSGSSTGETDDINLSVDISSLTAGVYDCNLIISDANAVNNPQVVDVNLIVIGPTIELSRTYFQFRAFEGGAPNDQILGISNIGGGTLKWAISEDCNWLTPEPNSGSSTGEVDDVNLSVDISGLTKGAYDCNLTVSDPNAENSPQMVAVSLFIYSSEELLVPSEYGTIQAGIDAATDWEVVVVEPNTYTGVGNRDLDFGGKAIIVRSIDPEDPCVVAATVINCNGSGGDPHRGFYFHSFEDGGSVVAGLTIKNGYVHNGNYGGGIYCSGSSPTIENCNIISNRARGLSFGQGALGGGIYCTDGSDVTLFGCIISGNSAVGRDGAPGESGGNAGSGQGGGVYCVSNNSVTILNCKIENNLAKGGDGGDAEFDGGHGGDGYGGGIYCDIDSYLEMKDCIIFSNVAGGGDAGWGDIVGFEGLGEGAGVYCWTADVANCLIEDNSVYGGIGWFIRHGEGGGIWCAGGTVITNCTLSGNLCNAPYNYVNGHGGGICCSSFTSPVITNCILWGNFDHTGLQIADGSPIVSYSDVEGGYAGTGNIDADPLFVDADGFDNIAGTADDNLRLSWDSPCIDAGNNNSVPSSITTDLDGRPRFSDGDCNVTEIVDMGAYEFSWAYVGDFDGECDVDFVDFSMFALAWLTGPGDPGYNPDFDVSLPADNYIDWRDLKVLTDNWLAGY